MTLRILTVEDVYDLLKAGDTVLVDGIPHIVTRRNGLVLGVDLVTPEGPKVVTGISILEHDVVKEIPE